MAEHLAYHYAHRGFHRRPNVPENSMAAFEAAVRHGFPVEFDVHLISDGGLVVFHDEDLERMAGVKGKIEDETIVSIERLRLGGTDEKIPTFDEVLDLFEYAELPLLIELKAAGGNHKELADKVVQRLKEYPGKFVIESFDPRVLTETRKIAPDITVGQLAQNFIKNREGLPFYQAVILTNMMFNVTNRPDFIA
ncbi:MAG: glycerophosphodiester phosphodiesterase, partial [Lachnospiraceae bacterium]|nr:glycerophosphodiester phosphodiesterase [Lachnospiraceae bacterium]